MDSQTEPEGAAIKQEMIIDIHMNTLKMKIKELAESSISEASGKGLPVRVVWSRGKKEAKTHYRYIDKDSNEEEQLFNGKIQINTILNLDPKTLLPTSEKFSRIAIGLNRNYDYKEIAET